MPQRLALVTAVLLALSAAPLRAWLERPLPPRTCTPEGRGFPPRHWLGCPADAGPPRALAGDERLVLGLPLDPNEASSRDLAYVPGLGRSVAAEIVADRERNGPFRTVDELSRVRGIGPRKLAAAAPHLRVRPVVAVPQPLR